MNEGCFSKKQMKSTVSRLVDALWATWSKIGRSTSKGWKSCKAKESGERVGPTLSHAIVAVSLLADLVQRDSSFPTWARLINKHKLITSPWEETNALDAVEYQVYMLLTAPKFAFKLIEFKLKKNLMGKCKNLEGSGRAKKERNIFIRNDKVTQTRGVSQSINRVSFSFWKKGLHFGIDEQKKKKRNEEEKMERNSRREKESQTEKEKFEKKQKKF